MLIIYKTHMEYLGYHGFQYNKARCDFVTYKSISLKS